MTSTGIGKAKAKCRPAGSQLVEQPVSEILDPALQSAHVFRCEKRLQQRPKTRVIGALGNEVAHRAVEGHRFGGSCRDGLYRAVLDGVVSRLADKLGIDDYDGGCATPLVPTSSWRP